MANHPELISSDNFNEKFKNYLRNFFVYSYFEQKDFKTIARNVPRGMKDEKEKEKYYKKHKNEDVTRDEFSKTLSQLKKVLEEKANVKWETSKSSKKAVCYTADSRNVLANPFFDLYQYSMCLDSDILIFYIILLALNEKVEFESLFNGSIEELIDNLKELNFYTNAGDWKNKPDKEFKRIQKEADKLLHSQKEHAYSFKLNVRDFSVDSCEKKINLTTAQLANIASLLNFDDNKYGSNLGYISLYNQKTWKNHLEELFECGMLQNEDNKWKLNDSIKDLFESEDIKNRFAEMVSFFSETHPLGVIGTYILRRFNSTGKHIRYKHNYIERALNDYNLIDILYAIEHGKWMKIQYRSAVDKEYQEILCYPLEVRESTQNGRQHLIYYSPVNHSITGLRIDFIDYITLGDAKGYSEAELDNAKKATKYAWGVSFKDVASGNVLKSYKPFKAEIIIEYGDDEPFIYERLVRERRHGDMPIKLPSVNGKNRVLFAVNIADEMELHPWIRSFTQRIVSVNIHKNIESDILEDAETMKKYNEAQKGLLYKGVEFVADSKTSNIHNRLFNKIYGYYYDSVGKLIFKQIREPLSRKELKAKVCDIVRESHYYSTERKNKRQEHVELRENTINNILCIVDILTQKNDGVSTFEIDDSITSYYDLIPLTDIERQWIYDILENPKAELFLEKTELIKIQEKVGNPGLFNSNIVKCYDQHKVKQTTHEVFSKVLSAITKKEKIKIEYSAKNKNGIYIPVTLEYSKRDDIFRVYCLDSSLKVEIFNLERIKNVELVNEEFSFDEAQKEIEAYFNAPKKIVEVSFTDFKNIPDRILNEFCCYKKSCERDGTEEAYDYKLKIYYMQDDCFEIVIRLLGYGPYIIVSKDDDKDSVYSEMMRRIDKQIELNKELKVEKSNQKEQVRE